MNRSITLLFVAMLVLAGCSSSHRPVYSGKEESTEGVPGFVGGKKVSPHIKLGQSYTVDGETYVPRNQPDYVEEGMASWYGPGFHGGKTANGERFDSAELTAAHRTLPLPSIVRVTMVSSGKQVYVRVNDRGPFAHSRIIDLSRGAAEKIGLLQAGVAKVRVEYMKEESERFAQLLSQGRDPKSIDVASEILNYTHEGKAVQYARGDVRVPSPASGVGWDRLNPISSAQADEPDSDATEDAQAHATAAPVSGVSAADLPAAAAKSNPAKPDMGAPSDDRSPFAAIEKPEIAPPPRQEVAAIAQKQAAIEPSAQRMSNANGYFIQLGAFLKMENATRVQKQYGSFDMIDVRNKPNAKGQMLYHVRMGPYATQSEGDTMLSKLRAAGAEEARLIHE